MATINPYLNFKGNTEEAFNFYKLVFGGEFASFMRFKDTPEAGKMPPDAADKIMHVALPIGKGNVLMATDALESLGQQLTVGNNFSISISTDSKEETERIYNKLSTGGKIEMPLGDTFWGAYFGMCADKFGIHWMVSYDNKQQK
jgi:PhnB protein